MRRLTPFLLLDGRAHPLRSKPRPHPVAGWLNVEVTELSAIAERRAQLRVHPRDLRPEHARARHHGRKTAVRG